MSSEAEIHFELQRHIQNAIDQHNQFNGMKFENSVPELNVNGGYADIVVFTERKEPFLVIEAKRPDSGDGNRNLDPYSPKVIEQAANYAFKIGAEYFATYNGRQLVLFQTFERGKNLLDRRSKAYEVKNIRKFASEFLKQLAALSQEEEKWEPKREKIIKRLKTFHKRLLNELKSSLKFKLDKNQGFQNRFVDWVEEQGWDIPENEAKERYTQQSAYLLMNKLLFYKILEDTSHDMPDLKLEELVKPDIRRKAFDKIIKKVDFEAVYEHEPIFDELHLTERAKIEVKEFLEELETYDLDKFKHDTIGHIYEEIIPPSERHALGQYYTPPTITELITKLTIKNPTDEILDPACGSGTFIINAYNRLKNLKKENYYPVTHQGILNQLYGIDINRFPAHLTALNLALQNLSTETREVNVEVEDFFNVQKSDGQVRIVHERASIRGSEETHQPKIPNKVDAVIGNPPYIRQEKIPDKERVREHLKDLGYEKFNERSDIYSYFFTHSFQFLKNGGRMGFITSDKWLTVGYGEDLQDFFLDNFKIKAIISFSKKVFEDPLVPTCITILEKSKDKTNSNIVKFLRIKEPMEINEIIDKIETTYESNILHEKQKYRLLTKKQKELRGTEKWNRFLFAPPIYWKLLNHEKITTLEEIAEVRRGITSGANKFFYLTEEEAEEWGIDSRFLTPLAKSIKQVDSVLFTKDDTDRLVIDLNDFVEEKFKDIDSSRIQGIELDEEKLPPKADLKEISSEEEYILHKLDEEGYENIFGYIVFSMWEKDWGRYNPPHKRPTCLQYRKQNKCWFNLGELRKPDIMFPAGCRKRLFACLNEGLVVDKRAYEINSSFREVLAGILNSSLIRFFRELHGRWNAGLNEMAVYETEDLPILDPRKIKKEEAKNIRNEILILSKKDRIKSKELDSVVLKPFDLNDINKKIYNYSKTLSKARREGTDVGELVSDLEDGIELEGAEIIGEDKSQKELGDF
ncbi:Type I restriction-modification system methyltransferase and restriction endonuclease [Methanonatronarchaeum thermophilum]|uniref:Type I restriction-modification system methyltransferase and restriction endonuclease n=1 Tax=Methanonatronarchaeum thermophilum TaxID=1927129 RepID=A0A1Y3GIW9_9EURY|nr:N-6 DNA methylase [Methanonatronarchaeum thermophilum]OUJ19336.1 Type I restriction-modification system methyltransferase and restriction endonuclease [Methanonatronarchaeum thermophilum]